MLPRRLRLSRGGFAPTTREMRAVSPHFSVSVRLTEGGGGCAAIISKKVAKLAVDRHRLKRRMLAVMLPWCNPTRAVMVYARAGSNRLPFPLLAEELTVLLGRTLSK